MYAFVGKKEVGGSSGRKNSHRGCGSRCTGRRPRPSAPPAAGARAAAGSRERYSDAPVTLYRATRLVLSDWNRKRPLLKRHSWMVLSLGSLNHFPNQLTQRNFINFPFFIKRSHQSDTSSRNLSERSEKMRCEPIENGRAPPNPESGVIGG